MGGSAKPSLAKGELTSAPEIRPSWTRVHFCEITRKPVVPLKGASRLPPEAQRTPSPQGDDVTGTASAPGKKLLIYLYAPTNQQN